MFRRLFSASSSASSSCASQLTASPALWRKTLERTRNVGIIAHIDAGKTTTTERFLYYSGLTGKLGNVDNGDTVTDYLPQERERGITITSAAITFGWKLSLEQSAASFYRINLIDTPGHIDFTMEVEKSLRVMDSAVIILDSVAGVQAQTKTVLRQSKKYKLPCIAFANKMDRIGASFENTLKSMEENVGLPIVPLQFPVPETTGRIDGNLQIYDLVSGSLIKWLDPLGETFETECAMNNEFVAQKRSELIERLCEWDDELLDCVVEDSSSSSVEKPGVIKADLLDRAIRRGVLKGAFVPVLLGASFRNRGVQPLMDAVVKYLPSPLDRDSVAVTNVIRKTSQLMPCDPKGPLLMLAFKVINDINRNQLLTFVRVYSGTLMPNTVIYNCNRAQKERVGKVYQMYADSLEEIPNVEAGSIAVLVAMKETCTGDTLVSVAHGSKPENLKHYGWRLDGIDTPPSVFSRALLIDECGSGSKIEQRINNSLAILQREDPSCQIQKHPETGQTLISGMGELHLEIILDRLKMPPWNLKGLSLGQIWISYRESLLLVPTYSLEVFTGRYQESAPVISLMSSEAFESGILVKFSFNKTNLQGNVMKARVCYLIESLIPSEQPPVVKESFRTWETLMMEAVMQLQEAFIKYRACVGPDTVTVADGRLVFPLKALTSLESMPLDLVTEVLADRGLAGLDDTSFAGTEAAKRARKNLTFPDSELLGCLVESMFGCMQRGPLLGFPLIGVRMTFLGIDDICLSSSIVKKNFAHVNQTLREAFSASFEHLSNHLLRDEYCVPMEPCMSLSINAGSEHSPEIINDLNRRRRALVTRSEIVVSAITGRPEAVIEAIAPISTLTNYSSYLRKLTSGTASVGLEYVGYKAMDSTSTKKWLLRGGTLPPQDEQ